MKRLWLKQRRKKRKKITLFGIGVMALLIVTSCNMQLETANKQLAANLKMYETTWDEVIARSKSSRSLL